MNSALPPLALLNGPPAAGKSSAAAALLSQVPGKVAVLEHDNFAQMAGAHLVTSTVDSEVWSASLEALVASAKAFTEAGVATLVVVNYGQERKTELEALLHPVIPIHVVLRPPWDTIEHRRNGRQGAGGLEEIDWVAHRGFYDDLGRMIEQGEFDHVLAGDDETPELVARHLAKVLRLS